jgi:hypothetical protein
MSVLYIFVLPVGMLLFSLILLSYYKIVDIIKRKK